MEETMGGESEIQLCESCQEYLRSLLSIHYKIDFPTRQINSGDPEWVFRMRKISFHVKAVVGWNLDIDSLHAMAVEIRAIFVQLDAVWKHMPSEFQVIDVRKDNWAGEARSGILATYDHPTTFTLASSVWGGGFDDGDDVAAFLRLASWMISIGVGYGLALKHLSHVLGCQEEIDSCLVVTLNAVRERAAQEATRYGHHTSPA